MRLGSEVPSALCVCLCATAFLSVLLHVRSTCVVTIAAVVCSPVQGGCLPVMVCCCRTPSGGVSPAWCLSSVSMDLSRLVPLPAFTMTRPSLKQALVAPGLVKLENGAVCGEW